jgi:alanyl aminopeptidase
MPWWDDLWLNESFATRLSHSIVEELKPEFRANEFMLQDAQTAMEQDSLICARKIREPIRSNHDIHNAFDAITYKKGSGVLSMLENYLSPKLFREAVSDHINKFSFGLSTTSDFLESLAKKSDTSLIKSAESFLNQNGFPLVTMSYQCSEKGFVIKAKQGRYIPAGSKAENNSLWRIPLCIGYGKDSKISKLCFTMNKKTKEQEARTEQCPDFIMPNYNGQGYYRFSLDILDWQNLLREAPKLSEADRMAVADSLMGELYRGNLDFEFVLDGLKNMVDKNSSTVTGYFMKVFKEAENYWMGNNKSRFTSLAINAIKPIYDNLKDKKDLNFDERLLRKNTGAFLASVIKDQKVREELLPKGLTYLDNLIKDQDLATDDLISESISIAIKDQPHFLEKISNKLKDITDTDIRFQILLGLSKNDGEQGEKVRSLVFGELRKNEQLRLFYDHLDNLKNQPATFSFLKNNFDKLKNHLSSSQLGSSVFLALGLCSEKDAQEVEDFFSPFIKNFQGGPRNLLEVVEKINLCAARKKRHEQPEKIVEN